MESYNTTCDICGAKAYYKVSKGNKELFFCGSHTRSNSATLLSQGFQIEPEDYATYGAETKEYKESKAKTAKADAEQAELEEHNTMRNKVKRMFYENPKKAIEEIFIPIARKESNYYAPTVYGVRDAGNGLIQFVIQPQLEPTNDAELNDFLAFNKVLRSIISSTLA